MTVSFRLIAFLGRHLCSSKEIINDYLKPVSHPVNNKQQTSQKVVSNFHKRQINSVVSLTQYLGNAQFEFVFSSIFYNKAELKRLDEGNLFASDVAFCVPNWNNISYPAHYATFRRALLYFVKKKQQWMERVLSNNTNNINHVPSVYFDASGVNSNWVEGYIISNNKFIKQIPYKGSNRFCFYRHNSFI